MKKTVVLLMTLLVLAGFTACGNTQNNSAAQNSGTLGTESGPPQSLVVPYSALQDTPRGDDMGAPTDPAVGLYKLHSITGEGVGITADMLQAAGVDIEVSGLDFKPNNTFVLVVESDDDAIHLEGTWRTEGGGYVIVDEEGEAHPVVFDATEMTMTLENEGNEVVFKQ